MVPIVFLCISGFCALNSRICDPRCGFPLSGSLSNSPSDEAQAGNRGCDRCTALGPAIGETRATSGAGEWLSSMAPRNEVAEPLSGFAYRRKFSSFCRLLDFSSSCRAASLRAPPVWATTGRQAETAPYRQSTAKTTQMQRMAVAVPIATAIRYPEPV